MEEERQFNQSIEIASGTSAAWRQIKSNLDGLHPIERYPKPVPPDRQFASD